MFLKDLAQYVNEVKRDNETLREIDQYQKSIENLVGHLFLSNKLLFQMALLLLCSPFFPLTHCRALFHSQCRTSL